MKMLNLPLNSELESQLTRRTFERRHHLPLSSDHLWQITVGVVRTVTWTEDGGLITLGIWGEGDIVGRALSSSDPYIAECLTQVSATALPKNFWYQATEALIQHVRVSKELLEIVR
jgi:CRP-like cAMP-binding protein